VRLRLFAAFGMLALALTASCQDNMMTGKLTPVPPVHRLAIENEGRVILIAQDPIIETTDPVHVERANFQHVPQDFRAAMTRALALAGFKVVTSPAEKHDLVGKLALAVREEPGKIHQTYRINLRAPDGAEVAQVDWAWPIGTYVEPTDVYEFATHNLATEVATSRKVLTYLRSSRTPKAPETDAGPPL
jgi:hypothetical protein